MEDFVSEAYTKLSDEDLVQLIKSGNETPLRVLIKRYIPIIKSKAEKFSFGADMDDFEQEGIMALYSAAGVFNSSISSFKTFACVCIERTMISYLRKAYSKKQIPKEALVYFDDNNEFPDKKTPESMIIEKEESDLLAKRIKEGLSKQEYKVLLLFLQGNSFESIANTLGLSLKAVNNSIYRARKKIEMLK